MVFFHYILHDRMRINGFTIRSRSRNIRSVNINVTPLQQTDDRFYAYNNYYYHSSYEYLHIYLRRNRRHPIVTYIPPVWYYYIIMIPVDRDDCHVFLFFFHAQT